MEPVKAILSTSLWFTIAAPVLPCPVIIFTTPSGKPESLISSANFNAVKGVEIGSGFGVVTQKGSEGRDEIMPDGFTSNNSGGTLGGISSGQDIIVKMALKPTSSILKPGATVTTDNKETTIVTKGRHDPCVGIRATPIAEAMMALVLCDLYLRDKAQNSN